MRRVALSFILKCTLAGHIIRDIRDDIRDTLLALATLLLII